MNKSTLINEILKKINFKIHPEKDIRKDYIYKIKKRLYKLTGNEKKFIDSNTKFENISKADLDAIQQLLLVDTMSRVSVGFIINQIARNVLYRPIENKDPPSIRNTWPNWGRFFDENKEHLLNSELFGRRRRKF